MALSSAKRATGKGWTQSDLAEALGWVNQKGQPDHGHVSRLESGKSPIDP